jgi:hypothetical protein
MRRLFPLIALACVACSDTATPEADLEVTPDVETIDLAGRSVYRLETEFNGAPLVLDRDLTGKDQYFAFGSTHIAPAVSFAMTDSVTSPRTMTVTLNFGIVIPSADHPIQTEGAGTIPFDDTPPSVDVFVGGLQYRSSLPGASGEIIVTDWSTETGGTVAGSFSGTLVAEGPTGKTLPVSGTFHFTLPAANAGQPQ